MAFSDLEQAFLEATGSPARASPGSGAARSSGGGAGSRSAPARSTPARAAPARAAPARTAPSRTAPTRSAPATGATTSGRPQQPSAGRGTRASPASTPATSQRSTGIGGLFDRFAPYVSQGWDFVRFGTQIAQQFRRPAASGAPPPDAGPAAGGPAPAGAEPVGVPTAPGVQPAGDGQPAYAPAPAMPQAVPAGGDQLAMLLQALRQRQIPPLPGPSVEPPAAPAAPQPDATALLRLILGNASFQQALQQTAIPGAARAVALPVPSVSAPRQVQSVQIPLGAVMNAIYTLAGQSMTELNAGTREEDPEVPGYLVSEEGEFIVDPASPEERGALVTHMFRLSEQAARPRRVGGFNEWFGDSDEERDECSTWARRSGSTR